MAGCTAAGSPQVRSIRDIVRESVVGVNRADGIDQKEAVLLAQSELILRNLHHRYDLDPVDIVGPPGSENWVLIFAPHNATLRDTLSSRDLKILVSKDYGHVEFQEKRMPWK